MRYLLLSLLLLSAPALANPFITADIDPRCTHCGIFMDAAGKFVIGVTAQGGVNICKHDIQGLPAGSHVVRLTCIVQNPPWADQESPQSVPFSFVVPSTSIPPAPAGIRLVP